MIFWEIFGEQGAPIRATVSEMDRYSSSRLMDLSEAQEGDRGARRRRGARLDARYQGSADHGRAHADPATEFSRIGPVTDADRRPLVAPMRSYRSAHPTGSRQMPRKATTRPPRSGIRTRTVVPAVTRMAERAIKDGVAGAIKRGTLGGIRRGSGIGGSFTGIR